MNLPQGALVTELEIAFFDSLPDHGAGCEIERCAWSLDSCVQEAWIESPPGFAGGDSTAYLSLSVPFTVDNFSNSYVVECILDGTAYLNRLKSFRLGYQLQLSPAPAVATFADVPVGAFGFQHIEALAASGITAGCGGGNFCPDRQITRVEMAIFLAKALGLHWYY